MTPLVFVVCFISTAWCIQQRTRAGWSRSVLWTLLFTGAIIVLVWVAFALLDWSGAIT
ncbi:MAG: hypothetical protein QM692_23725 [Thermomicrobiales bacterium]